MSRAGNGLPAQRSDGDRGYRSRTLAEDFDITIAMLELGYRAVYEPKAVAYTSAMTSWKGLNKQRLRWSRAICRSTVSTGG